IILLDCDVWLELPVLALRLREALRSGGKLYIAGPSQSGLARDASEIFATTAELRRALGDAPPGPVSILGAGAAELAQAFEATGLVGQPATAANGWSAYDLPAASFQAESLLLVGSEPWPELAGKRCVSLRWAPGGMGSGVLLPIAHPYEQSGTLVNVDGQEQRLQAGSSAPAGLSSDWVALTQLANALGVAAPGTAEDHRTVVG
ncbi:MAG: hypothetical protein JOZ39_02525, partial [Chloroflexi bacterium]|nr:hypothetical protein [Chloroflexota bacterium]